MALVVRARRVDLGRPPSRSSPDATCIVSRTEAKKSSVFGRERIDLGQDCGGETLVMGILNVTPDSFSDAGEHLGLEDAVRHAVDLVAQGAHVIDIGAESTRPGSVAVPASVECDRLLPVIRAVRQVLPEIVLSVDTYKADVAAAALECGADIINDVWGLKWGLGEGTGSHAGAESPMARVVARAGCPVVIMHNRKTPTYASFMDDVIADLLSSVRLAKAAGVRDSRIWLDPGFGFAKNDAQNLEVLGGLPRIVSLGYPVVLGTSRKSTLGRLLDQPVHARQDGTAATVVHGVAAGCRMVRVHDVRHIAPFLTVADAIKRSAAQAGAHGGRRRCPSDRVSMPDVIIIRDLRFYAHHGAIPEENVLGQVFTVTLEVELNLAESGSSDRLECALDYRLAIEAVRNVMLSSPPVKLIETLATRAADAVLALDARILAVAVEVTKPNAPVAAEFSGISARIRRTRGQANA